MYRCIIPSAAQRRLQAEAPAAGGGQQLRERRRLRGAVAALCVVAADPAVAPLLRVALVVEHTRRWRAQLLLVRLHRVLAGLQPDGARVREVLGTLKNL